MAQPISVNDCICCETKKKDNTSEIQTRQTCYQGLTNCLLFPTINYFNLYAVRYIHDCALSDYFVCQDDVS